MEENKKSYYAVIPAPVRYSKEITNQAKLIYGEISALCNDKGYCWANNNYFAEQYGISKKTVINSIQALQDANFIKIQYLDNTGNNTIRHIYINEISRGSEKNCTGYGKNFHGVVKKIARGSEKNCTHNNTINNTNNNINNIATTAPTETAPSFIDSDSYETNKIAQALDKYIPMANITFYETLNNYDIKDELKIYALKECAMNNKKTAAYLRAILENIKSQGYQSVEELEKAQEEYQKKKKTKNSEYITIKNRELDIREKELALKEQNQPYYQKQIEMQSGKVEQKQQKKEDQDKSMALFTQYYDDYIKGNISKEKLQELGMDESLFFQLDSDKENYENDLEMKRLKAEYERKWGKKNDN